MLKQVMLHDLIKVASEKIAISVGFPSLVAKRMLEQAPAAAKPPQQSAPKKGC